MKIDSIQELEPELSRCIEVASDRKLFLAGGNDGRAFASHNSVAQQIVFLGCALRPDQWTYIGIDLKRVELSHLRKYRDVCLGIAVTTEQAVWALRYAQNVMMTRYRLMEAEGFKKYTDMDPSAKGLLIMVDEASELLSPGSNKDEKELKGEAKEILSSIARLGRAASVHLVVATQKPSVDILGSEFRDNCGMRMCCGPVKAGTSKMLLENSEGQRIRPNPPGGAVIQLQSDDYQVHLQGFYSKDDFLDDYLKRTGKSLTKIDGDQDLELGEAEEDEDTSRPEESWDEDMESIKKANKKKVKNAS